jgi:hypothetical protein
MLLFGAPSLVATMIDGARVWQTVTADLPGLLDHLASLLPRSPDV